MFSIAPFRACRRRTVGLCSQNFGRADGEQCMPDTLKVSYDEMKSTGLF
jgi:hypothetical protein